MWVIEACGVIEVAPVNEWMAELSQERRQVPR